MKTTIVQAQEKLAEAKEKHTQLSKRLVELRRQDNIIIEELLRLDGEIRVLQDLMKSEDLAPEAAGKA